LLLTEDNYHLDLSILERLYSNHRTIAQDHFDQLWAARDASLGDSTTIRQLLNTITASVGALRIQKYAVDKWDPILLYLFQKNLNAPLRGQWELLVDTNDDLMVEDFKTFLTKFGKAAGTGSGVEKTLKKSTKSTTLHVVQTAQQSYSNSSERKN